MGNGSVQNPMMGATLLVLAPTRELAMQIEVECQKFGGPLGIRSVCCYGGSPKGEQLGKMRQARGRDRVRVRVRVGVSSPNPNPNP